MLNGSNGLAGQFKAAIGPVEQRDMGLHCILGQAFAIDCKAMIHGDDFHLTRFQIFHRVVSSVMALIHLDGLIKRMN